MHVVAVHSNEINKDDDNKQLENAKVDISESNTEELKSELEEKDCDSSGELDRITKGGGTDRSELNMITKEVETGNGSMNAGVVIKDGTGGF